MTTLLNKRVLLGICGGIAAYKSAAIVRSLSEAGAIVRVVMTEAAKSFITPLTLQALSGNEVRDSMFDMTAEKAMSHIELARWADLILIAPATADIIAHLANGFANNLLTTVYLATSAPLVLAPAMNQQMWSHPATQQNIARLQHRGSIILGPDSGYQACGEYGPGRMLEPDAIVAALTDHSSPLLLQDRTVIITAGPTQEAIDPVRYITNHSSGKMGYAIAQAALEAGAKVILISGPTALICDARITRINVITAQEMYQQVLKHISPTTIFIATAAVTDFRCEQIATQKLKRGEQQTASLKLIANPDIVASIAASPARPYFIVGFAAETENLLENARTKLTEKKLDMVVANQVGGAEGGFNRDENAVQIITATTTHTIPLASKSHIARQLIKLIAETQPQHP